MTFAFRERNSLAQPTSAVSVCAVCDVDDFMYIQIGTSQYILRHKFIYVQSQNFYVLLTVHLSIILVINQLDAENLLL